MLRETSLNQILSHPTPFDIAIIGGGATGVGIAVDSASRGYSTVLLEQSDFGKGTSSRSTKLVHGGVRYLQQGNISLVMEALKERGILRRNAPHLVHDLAFIVPNYAWWEAPFYGIGMKVYDMLAGRYGFGKSSHLSKQEVLERIPTLETKGLRGGVLYFDGQFDDSRLLINLAQTATAQGAALLNYAKVTGLAKDADGFVNGLAFTDLESGQNHSIQAHAVINATGAFSDSVRKIDDPAVSPMIAPSQGVHVVLDGSFLGLPDQKPGRVPFSSSDQKPGRVPFQAAVTAIMVPRTSDGRVMFAIPWHGYALIGTTDTPIASVELEPTPLDAEIEFILETAERFLARKPTRADIKSVFTGIRPLVKAGESADTAALSRDHTITISRSGLLTIAGGKWTTYRKMAEDAVDHAATLGKLDERDCVTKNLAIHGSYVHAAQFGELAFYGSDAPGVRELIESSPEHSKRLHSDLPLYAGQVVWAARFEMARTVDDVLARRTRWLFLDSKAAVQMASGVAEVLARELGRDRAWQDQQVQDFAEIAKHYFP